MYEFVTGWSEMSKLFINIRDCVAGSIHTSVQWHERQNQHPLLNVSTTLSSLALQRCAFCEHIRGTKCLDRTLPILRVNSAVRKIIPHDRSDTPQWTFCSPAIDDIARNYKIGSTASNQILPLKRFDSL